MNFAAFISNDHKLEISCKTHASQLFHTKMLSESALNIIRERTEKTNVEIDKELNWNIKLYLNVYNDTANIALEVYNQNETK